MHYALITFHSSKRSLYSLTYLQHCIRQSSVCNLWLLTEDVHHTVSFLLITYEDNLQFDDLFQSLEPVLLQKPCEATPLSFQIKKKERGKTQMRLIKALLFAMIQPMEKVVLVISQGLLIDSLQHKTSTEEITISKVYDTSISATSLR